MGDSLFVAGVAFCRAIVGLVARPYEAYRRIVDRGTLWELVYVAFVLAVYFATAALVRTAAFRPFLLTRQFLVLAAAAAMTYFMAAGLFWLAGRLVGARGKFPAFMLAWGYTLIPTLVWFWSTSVLYVLLPPPRTTSPQGMAFSILYLLFSAVLLFWKIILSYLALRFGLKLDLAKIAMVSIVVLPVLGLYSIGMYRMGIFRIPFI